MEANTKRSKVAMKLKAGEVRGVGRNHIIKRPRLTRLLDATDARIIMLIAPAGYGKTTLAREWLSTRPHTWYRGTSATADVAALALELAKAASKIVPGAGATLTKRLRISNSPADEVEALAGLLADDLQAWPADSWLMFDDYHFACDSEAGERFVEELLWGSPIRLLVASRSRPRWGVARRVVYGEVCEIGHGLLARNGQEAQLVLTNRPTKETSGLIALANGWPALIGLATLPDELAFPTDSLPDELYGYFADELYQALSPTTRQGLRRLALAPAVTDEVARLLVGARTQPIIEDALKVGFFSSWSHNRWEFHPLLRTFLAAKFIGSEDDPDGAIVDDLVRLQIDREEWDSAFELVERFFDSNLLVTLFEAALLRMLDEARLPTLIRWIELAADHRIDLPVVDFAEAEVSFKRGDLRRAEAFATQAARRFSENHPLESRALWLAGVSAHMMARDEVALEHFDQAARAAISETDSRQAVWGRFSATIRLDRVAHAEELLNLLRDSSGKSADELLRIATGELMLGSLTGRVHCILEAVDNIAPLKSRVQDPLILSSFLNVHSALLALGGRYDDALAAVDQEMEVASVYGLRFALPHAQFQRALALFGLRAFRECKMALLASERGTLADEHSFLRLNIGILRARLHLTAGSDEAVRTLECYEYRLPHSSMEAEYFAWWSFALAATGEPKQAQVLAKHAESMSPCIEVSGLVPWTRAVVALSDNESPQAAVQDAFRITLETGNIDAFVTVYRTRPDILKLLAMNRQNQEQLKRTLELARDYKLAQAIGLHFPATPATHGPSLLSKREREVLELVSQGLLNKEIARVLFIAESTVKAHVRKICKKLGVRTRTEAAMRAAELSG